MATDVGIDAGDMERLFRGATGVTIKRYIDELVGLLRGGTSLGYELGDRLKFRNDEAFYRWVKRVFGMPFKALRWRFRESHSANPLRGGATPVTSPAPVAPTKKLHQKFAPKKGMFIRLHKQPRRSIVE